MSGWRNIGCLGLLALLLHAPLQAGLPHGYERIYLSPHASAEVREAATDLASLMDKAFGARPAIRRLPLMRLLPALVIGPDPHHPAFDGSPLTDEVLMERHGNALYITGSDNPSTRFAVYRFAERFLGWRYYQPGKLGLERLDHPPDPPPVDGPREILYQSKAAFHSRNPSLGRQLPGPFPWRDWHGLRERFQFNHMLHRVVTPDLFDTRPDWFAKDASGEPMRPPFYPRVHGYNDHPDLGNGEVRPFVSKTVLEALQGKRGYPPVLRAPGSISVSLGLGDSFVFGDFADDYPWKPRAYFRRWPDWSNHVFAYTNAVAAAVSEDWRRGMAGKAGDAALYFGTLAYLTWENVPEFPLHPSIVPYLTFDRSQWHDKRSREDDLENVAAWNDTEAPFLGTWDYLFGYGFLIPRSMVSIVAESIPALHERGVRAYFSQVAPLWPFDGHTNWLATRLLWDPGTDAAAAMEEYYREFFGPAADLMRTFFDFAGEIWMAQEGGGWWLRFWKDPWQAALWSPEDMDRGAALLDKAMLEAGDSGSHRERVSRTRELFKLTQAFHEYEWQSWNLACSDSISTNYRHTEKSLAAAGKALERRRLMTMIRDGLVAEYPLMHYARDLEWVFRYGRIGADLAAGLRNLPEGALRDKATALLNDWAGLENHGLLQLGRFHPVLYDTDFSGLDNPRVWHQRFMDSEGAWTGGGTGGKGFRVANVRRGHLYQYFKASPGELFLGEVDLTSRQSPSGEISIRLDFLDKDLEVVGKSRRGRFIPEPIGAPEQTIRILMPAPPGAEFGRLFIRFYELDQGSEASLHEARVFRVGFAPVP